MRRIIVKHAQYASLLNSKEHMQLPTGQLYTVSAPSGAGKTSLVKELVLGTEGLSAAVSHTTRAMRDGEQMGLNYHFVDDDEFQRMNAAGEFLESATVFNHSYGTSRAEVEQRLKQGDDIILEIDWQGAQQVKSLLPETLAIFIVPPSVETLQERLRGRGQDDEAVIASRMQAAVDEISHFAESDYLIVNEVFDTALEELQCIVHSQRLRLKGQQQRHATLLKNLLS